MSEHEFCPAAKAEISRLLRIVQRLEGHLAYMRGRLSRAPLARRTVERERGEERMDMATKMVIVRDSRAGVHVGELVSLDVGTKIATLKNVRKIWYWKGAGSCHGLAAHGPDYMGSKVAPVVPGVVLLDVVEVVDCTAEGAAQCMGAPVWRP